MSHVINATRRIDETVLLTGRSLFPVKVRIVVNIDTIAGQGKLALEKLQALSAKFENPESSDAETFATFNAEYVTLCNTVMGKAPTDRMVKYFDGEILEMAAAVTPFIMEVIIPKIQLHNNAVKRMQSGSARGALKFVK